MIDLLIGGSPCQGFSFAGKQLNFNDPRSKLFFDYVKAKNALNPKYFLLENVKMKEEFQNIISEFLGVEPIEINSSLVSAQSRKRLYWTNIPNITQPKDKEIYLKDILLPNTYTEFDKAYCLTSTEYGEVSWSDIEKRQETMVWDKPIRVATFGKGGQGQRVYSINGKSVTLSALGGGWGAKTGLYQIGDYARKLEPIECERLQTLPDNYTEGISKNERKKVCGNGWTVDVIAHILSFIPETYLHTVVSLFDGISCGQVALERAEKVYNQYYASEVDKNAMKIAQKNYPHTMQIGDVTKINWEKFQDMINMIQNIKEI